MTDSTTPVSGDLARHLAAEWRRLRRAWAAARTGEPAALRRVRITTRRLREGLEVAAGVGGRGDVGRGHAADRVPADAVRAAREAARARRALRRLRRALGPARESAVSLAIFDAAAARHAWNAELVAPVRRGLDRAARRRRAALVSWLAGHDRTALERKVAAAVDALAGVPADAGARALDSHLLRRSRDVRRAAARCGTLYDPERLHALRIAVKKLRYALESAAAAGLPVAAAQAPLVALQQQLGRLQDMQVLQRTVQAALAARRAAPPATAAAIVIDALERDCRWQHAEIVTALAGIPATLANVRGALVARAGARRGRAARAAAPEAAAPDRRTRRRRSRAAAGRQDAIGY